MAVICNQAVRITVPNPVEACYPERFEGFKQNSKNERPWLFMGKCQMARVVSLINIVGLEMVRT